MLGHVESGPSTRVLTRADTQAVQLPLTASKLNYG